MKKTALMVSSLTVFGLILIIVVAGERFFPPTTTRLNMDAVMQTSEAQQTGAPGLLSLSLHTDKSCYLTTEPVQARIEIVNLSENPVTIWKTLRFFSGNAFQRATLYLNGSSDRAMVMVLEVTPPQEDEYVTLLSYEAIVTLIPDVRSLTASLDLSEGIPEGVYELEVEYRNDIPGILHDIVIAPDGTDADLIFEPREVWTGILHSGPVTIHVVNNLEQCPSSSIYQTATPLPTSSVPFWR